MGERDEVGRLLRRHFEREVQQVRVPDPILPAGEALDTARERRRFPPFLADGLARAAAVVFAVGALVLLGSSLQKPAALQDTLAAAVRERVFERLLPNTGSLMDLIDASFGEEKTK